MDTQKQLMNATQPERPGATVRLQYVVTATPEKEDVKYYWILKEGHLIESRLGELEDPEVTLTAAYDDAVKIQKGELDTTVAFMQGRVKVAGNMGKVMSLLPFTSSKAYRSFQEELRRVTEH